MYRNLLPAWLMIMFICKMRPSAFETFRLVSSLPQRLVSSRTDSSTCSLRATHRGSAMAVVGGGLAGLSTVYHYLEKAESCEVTVFDAASPGQGGASSVAGGLLHPLSPRGKLVHRGLEGLGATGRLVEAALAASGDDGSIVLRDELYRLAVAEQHATDLQNVAANHADDWAEWIDRAELPQHRIRGTTLLGALRMHGPCKVLHVPSYLRGLWKACEVLAETKGCGVKWFTLEDDVAEAWKDRLEKYDAVVLAAGAGLFQSGLLSPGDFPVQLVRGQSLELRRRSDAEQPAILCGKYLSPVPNNSSLTLVGATHEFAATPLTKDEVISEMKRRTADFAPDLWADDVEVERLTVGTRVQSERSSLGRLPLIGRLPNCDIHSNAWLFTGLSSRGLLYHGLYGDMLTDEIRAGNEDAELSRDSCLTWWKKK